MVAEFLIARDNIEDEGVCIILDISAKGRMY
jgi:hypothetical protein